MKKEEEFLEVAEEHIFSMGLPDSGTRLCLSNMKFGLAKIHCWQRKMGLSPLATFIATPDATVTRNRGRWDSGFGYGGKVSWGQGDQEVVFLEIKPNACGMLVGGLERLPTENELLERVDSFQKKSSYRRGVKLEWDFSQGNHFIEVFSVRPKEQISFPPWVFIIHGSAGELKDDSAMGYGLYWNDSSRLRQEAQVMRTPFGLLYLLEGKKALDYLEFYRFADEFSKEKRQLVADHLFGDFHLISNETHQGLLNCNEVILGCHYIKDTDTLYPLTLRADIPAYLLRGKKNLKNRAIEALGFTEKAREWGVYDRLSCANIIPHGGGYVFPQMSKVERIYRLGGKRYFRIAAPGRNRTILSNIRGMPYQYRGKEVLDKIVELNLGEVVAELHPLWTIQV